MGETINSMTKKTISPNAGNSGRISLSGPELKQFDADVGDHVKVDVAESTEIAEAIIKTRDHEEFVIVSKSN